MSLDERRFGLPPVYPDVIFGMEKVEEEGEKYEEWLSPDEKYKVILTIVGGGKVWDGVWLKEMCLLSMDDSVGSEMMRVQWVKQKNNPEIVTNIYVDVLKINLTSWYFEVYGYSSDNDGKLEKMEKITLPNIKPGAFVMEECIEKVANTPVRFLLDLPERIDVEETALLFREHLEDRDFSLPILVPE